MRIKTMAAAALATTTLLGTGTAAFADTGSSAAGSGGSSAAGSTTGSSAPTTTTTQPPAPAAGPAGAGCDSDSEWPAYVQGAPANFKAGSDGVFLWHYTTGGWGLRVSHPKLPGQANHVVFSGVISSAGVLGHLKRVDLEKNDSAKISADGHVLTFRFNNYGGVDGVDFTTSCTPGLKVGLKDDGKTFQTRYIHLGPKNAHPGSDPFLIRRVSSDTGTSASGDPNQPPAAS